MIRAIEDLKDQPIASGSLSICSSPETFQNVQDVLKNRLAHSRPCIEGCQAGPENAVPQPGVLHGF